MLCMALPLDVCIRGGGIVGRTLALLLARERLRVGLVAPAIDKNAANRPDVRAYALNLASRNLLESLRCWPDPVAATPVLHMKVSEDLGGEVNFDAAQCGTPALTWIVDVPVLEAQLANAVHFQPLIELLDVPAPAALTVVCEGKASSTRAEFGVDFEVTPYAQHAIAARIACEKPHEQIARQWFTQGEILAFLPLGGAVGNSVAIVWSVSPEHAAKLLQLSPEDFCLELQATSQHSLGQLTLASERAVWPLQKARARQWTGRTAAGAWVLAGDAAHNVHPLAGQGLNMGLADVSELAKLIRERDYWRPVGDDKLLRRYERSRKAGILSMATATDGLQWLFSQHGSTWGTLRNWGMNRIDHSGLLKQWMARQAMDF
jgi:2-polyprenyl-6-methoxyphenol hydroxylase-like FAD-dependent oxidoreductase